MTSTRSVWGKFSPAFQSLSEKSGSAISLRILGPHLPFNEFSIASNGFGIRGFPDFCFPDRFFKAGEGQLLASGSDA